MYVVVGLCICVGYYAVPRQFVSRGGNFVSPVERWVIWVSWAQFVIWGRMTGNDSWVTLCLRGREYVSESITMDFSSREEAVHRIQGPR